MSSKAQKAVGITMLVFLFFTILVVLPFLWDCYDFATGSFHFTLEAAVGTIILGAGITMLVTLFVGWIVIALWLIMR